MNIADRKGSLSVGKDADVVIFDENITIHSTMVKGKIIYQSSSAAPVLSAP
ncbi:MAG: amidohydrolase family protein [Puia sp.]